MQFGEGNLGPVSTCCYKTALQPDSVFCGECGKPILRCMAYAECGGLLGEDGRCSVCVAPQLYLDKGAVKEVKAGGALVLPLIFANASPIKRPLFITNVWAREGGGQRVPQELAWERLDAGASNPLWVQTGAMERQGRQKLEVSFTIATRYRWREEQFAFLSNLELEVDQGGSPVIHQTINATGGGQGAVGGHTIYAPTTVTTGAGGNGTNTFGAGVGDGPGSKNCCAITARAQQHAARKPTATMRRRCMAMDRRKCVSRRVPSTELFLAHRPLQSAN